MTTFVTQWGTLCYKVMAFSLNNAGETYQRVMVALFHDMIHHEKEVYVDDMISRSQTKEEDLGHLHKLFERLKKYKLRLNPNKFTFGVRFGKLLGFVVSGKGIEVDPIKVKAIQEIPAPCSEKEVRGFLGRLNYSARFNACIFWMVKGDVVNGNLRNLRKFARRGFLPERNVWNIALNIKNKV